VQEFQDGGSTDVNEIVPDLFKVLYATSEGGAVKREESKDDSLVNDSLVDTSNIILDSSIVSENNTSLIAAE